MAGDAIVILTFYFSAISGASPSSSRENITGVHGLTKLLVHNSRLVNGISSSIKGQLYATALLQTLDSLLILQVIVGVIIQYQEAYCCL